ncbi:hypothetical protein D3C78_1687220 [compost metagenome]
MVAPQRQQHVGHHHYQRRTLGQLLIQTEQQTQHRDGNQPAANAEQSAQGAQQQPQSHIEEKLQ